MQDAATNMQEDQNDRPKSRIADDRTVTFTNDLAELISKYEADTGNRVAVNMNVTWTAEDGSPTAPFCYGRNVKLTDELGTDVARPVMANALDVSPGLAVYQPDPDAEPLAVVQSMMEQCCDYSDSSAGPFVIMRGNAQYRNEQLSVDEQDDFRAKVAALTGFFGNLLGTLSGAHGDDCSCGHDH